MVKRYWKTARLKNFGLHKFEGFTFAMNFVIMVKMIMVEFKKRIISIKGFSFFGNGSINQNKMRKK
jgi:hypothetical protein